MFKRDADAVHRDGIADALPGQPGTALGQAVTRQQHQLQPFSLNPAVDGHCGVVPAYEGPIIRACSNVRDGFPLSRE